MDHLLLYCWTLKEIEKAYSDVSRKEDVEPLRQQLIKLEVARVDNRNNNGGNEND